MLADEDVLPTVIGRRAAEDPDRAYVVDAESGAELSYGAADTEARGWAAAFRRAGVETGSTVLVMLPPSFEAVGVWLGVARLRALEVPVNTAYRGRMLRYVVGDSQATVAVVHADYLAAFAELGGELAELRTIVVVGTPAQRPGLPVELVDAADFLGGAPADEPAVTPTGRDIASVMYTSGTTGPSKGVLVTWTQAMLTATAIMPTDRFDGSDAFYSPFPMFHMSGKGPLYATALLGARTVIRRQFSTDAFWEDIRRHGATTTILLGAMANFLVNQPAADDDADTPLRDAMMLPLVSDTKGFMKRFGLDARTTFNMTETACCILANDGLADETSCGRIRPGFQARVVDGDDEEVAFGELGELVLRGDEPWTLMAGYWRKPEATVAAWRNQWLHTGDGFIRDADGNFSFVDRVKDAIRRRGENISSFEVEAEVNDHPDVLESAAIAVPSEFSEDEVKVVVVARPGSTVDPAELVEFLRPRMARFMLPRYVEVVDVLPKTPTEKVRKAELRAAGITESTWDRVAG